LNLTVNFYLGTLVCHHQRHGTGLRKCYNSNWRSTRLCKHSRYSAGRP